MVDVRELRRIGFFAGCSAAELREFAPLCRRAAYRRGQAIQEENAPVRAVRAVLARYKSAIERLDASGTEALFTEDSAVFETGGVEGTYKEYLAHHLGPELAAFRAFAFSDYAVAVRIEGDLALATETYNYRIETKTGEIAMRRGVATSVLTRTVDGWKILVMHNSARKPKGT